MSVLHYPGLCSTCTAFSGLCLACATFSRPLLCHQHIHAPSTSGDLISSPHPPTTTFFQSCDRKSSLCVYHLPLVFHLQEVSDPCSALFVLYGPLMQEAMADPALHMALSASPQLMLILKNYCPKDFQTALSRESVCLSRLPHPGQMSCPCLLTISESVGKSGEYL